MSDKICEFLDYIRVLNYILGIHKVLGSCGVCTVQLDQLKYYRLKYGTIILFQERIHITLIVV